MIFERESIRRMQGYSWGEQPQDAATLKLNTNENPYPPSPDVQAELSRFDAALLRRYPQPTADRLRDLIAAHYKLERNNVLVTNGGDELLRLAFMTYVDPGAAFGTTEPGYSLYPVLAAIFDCRVVAVPLTEDWALPADFASRLNAADVKLACVVCPHAPSGRLLDHATLATVADELTGVLIVDEAYVDFVDSALGHDSIDLVRSFDNVLLLRSFSKGYSLAGLRVGYALGSEALLEPMRTKTRDSYNVDAVSQALAAAAFSDQTYAESTWRRVRDERDRLRDALRERGFTVPPSQSNFLLARVPPGKHTASDIYTALKQRGILVRHFAQPRLDDKLRITIGTPEENTQLLAALDALLAAR